MVNSVFHLFCLFWINKGQCHYTICHSGLYSPTSRVTDLSCSADFRPRGHSVSGAGPGVQVRLRLACGLLSGGVKARRVVCCGVGVRTKVGVGARRHVSVGAGRQDSVGADQVGQQRASGGARNGRGGGTGNWSVWHCHRLHGHLLGLER